MLEKEIERVEEDISHGQPHRSAIMINANTTPNIENLRPLVRSSFRCYKWYQNLTPTTRMGMGHMEVTAIPS